MTATLLTSSPRLGAAPCAPWPGQGGFFGLNRAVTNTESTSTCTNPDPSDREKWSYEGYRVDTMYESQHAFNMVIGPSMIYYRTTRGPLALNRDDGTEAWKGWSVNPSINTNFDTDFYVTDVILGSNNLLFVPAAHMQGAGMLALDAYTGQLVWGHYPADERQGGGAGMGADAVYMQSYAGSGDTHKWWLIALDRDSGEEQWKKETDSNGSPTDTTDEVHRIIKRAPLVRPDGAILTLEWSQRGGYDGVGSKVYLLRKHSATDGTELWKRAGPHDMKYNSQGQRQMVQSMDHVFVQHKSDIEKVDASDGTLVWRYDPSNNLMNSFVTLTIGYENEIYFSGGSIFRFEDTGTGLEEEWRLVPHQLGVGLPSTQFMSASLSDDGTLYVQGNHYLLAVGVDGVLRWSHANTGSDHRGGRIILANVAIGDDRIVYTRGEYLQESALLGPIAHLGCEHTRPPIYLPMGHERTSDRARRARSRSLIGPRPASVVYAEHMARVVAVYPDCPCSNHGTLSSGACTCDVDYGLSDCSVHCPSSGVSTFCSSHGTCDASLGASMVEYSCECVSGYAGSDCGIECPGGADSPCSGHGTCSEDSATVRVRAAVAVSPS